MWAQLEQDRLGGRMVTAAGVRGPITATYKQLHDLGWAARSATLWRDPDGYDWDLGSCSLPGVNAALERSAQKEAWSYSVLCRPQDAEGAAEGVDATTAWRLLDSLPPARAAVLKGVLVGGQWTMQHAFRARKSDHDRCPVCQQHADTLQNRHWHCPGIRPCLEFDTFPWHLWGITPETCFLTRGLVPASWTRLDPPPAEGRAAQHPPGWQQAGRAVTGLCATDGGAADPGDPRKRRAGWALVCQGEQVSAWGALGGPVQTVYRAEVFALWQLVRVAVPPLVVLIDNLAVQRLAARISLMQSLTTKRIGTFG